MDTAQWPHQDILVRPMEEIVTNKGSSIERKVRPQKEEAVNCPRCNSTNTKFCYYNNYSLSQPRYFCKTCRRYWTEGGSLRNIPVGGGSRKNKRSSSSSSSNSSKKISDLVPSQQNPKISEPQDLNLGIYSTAPHHHAHQLIQLQGFGHHHNNKDLQINPSSSSPSALELLTGITSTTRGLSSFMSMQQTMNHDPNDTNVYTPASSSGFHLPDFRPSLNFSLDGLGSNYGSFQGVEESSGKHLLFPFEDLKQVSSSTNNNNNNNANDADHQENGEQNGGAADSTGYWNGVIGGGSW